MQGFGPADLGGPDRQIRIALDDARGEFRGDVRGLAPHDRGEDLVYVVQRSRTVSAEEFGDLGVAVDGCQLVRAVSAEDRVPGAAALRIGALGKHQLDPVEQSRVGGKDQFVFQ